MEDLNSSRAALVTSSLLRAVNGPNLRRTSRMFGTRAPVPITLTPLAPPQWSEKATDERWKEGGKREERERIERIG